MIARRRHEVISLQLEVMLAAGCNDPRAIECQVINLTSAVTLATADGSPLSGCWS